MIVAAANGTMGLMLRSPPQAGVSKHVDTSILRDARFTRSSG
jgi:hypothetical protein